MDRPSGDVGHQYDSFTPAERDPVTEVSETVHLAELSYRQPALYVNVDFVELVDRYGETHAWEILGKLKDLLG